MTVTGLRTVVAVDAEVDRQLVQSALPQDGSLQFVGALDVYEGSSSTLEDSPADVVLVACAANAPHVPAFVEGAVRQRPNRPVIVLVTGTPNGDVRRIFEAGADDIVTLTPTTAPTDVLFAVEKAVARRSGAANGGSSSFGEMICVLGPKGGVGKTVAACNLAVALAGQGRSVTLVDLDLQFGDVGLTLGLAPNRTVFDLAKAGGSLDREKLDAYCEGHASGLRVLLAPTRPEQARAVTPEFLRELYAVLRSGSDYVVLDTPSRFDSEVLQAIDLSTELCVVSALDAPSLKNTKLVLEALDRMGQRSSAVRVLLNRADSRVGLTHGDATSILGRQPDLLIPSHRDVTVSVNEGVPVVTSRRSDVAKAFSSLAEAYAATGDAARQPSRTAGSPARRFRRAAVRTQEAT
jgi:pilus assembly protein CpaE